MANATAAWSGKPIAFLMAFGVVLLWAITGPIFHYSDTWQLVINTGTTIVTFLMHCNSPKGISFASIQNAELGLADA